MNQRILLPAIIIGGLFAVALGFVRGFLPESAIVRFALDAAFLIGAVLVYGVLMREAAVAASGSQAPSSSGRSRRRRSTSGAGTRSGRSRRSGQRDDGERKGDGDGDRGGRGRGGRGGDRTRKPAREERPAAPAGPREEGQIKWFSGAKGYGFIIRPNGDEIFVHHRALRDKSRREIPDGQAVSYVVVDRDKGPQADDVEVTGAQPAENAA